MQVSNLESFSLDFKLVIVGFYGKTVNYTLSILGLTVTNKIQAVSRTGKTIHT